MHRFIRIFTVHISEKKKTPFEPVHDETYNKNCVTSKDLDQPVHPPSMARILVYPSLDSLESVDGTCDQQRLIRLHCEDAQSDLDLHLSHKSYCRICRALVHFSWHETIGFIIQSQDYKVSVWFISRFCLDIGFDLRNKLGICYILPIN